jgi:hypothetical protein
LGARGQHVHSTCTVLVWWGLRSHQSRMDC